MPMHISYREALHTTHGDAMQWNGGRQREDPAMTSPAALLISTLYLP